MTISRPFSTRSHRRSPALLIASAVALACACSDDPLGELEGGGDDVTFTSIYNSDAFQECAGCHAPDAPGQVEGVEATQDWSTRERALATLRGNASGLIGNFQDCNGVPLVGDSAEDSLLVAALDEDVRRNFSLASFPDCTGDTIADQTVHLMSGLPDSVLDDLKAWIDAGAPAN